MRAPVLALSVLLLAACNHSAAAQGEVHASGTGGERSYPVGAFQSVSLAGPYDVVVAVGGAPSVRAVGDAKLLDRLEIRVSGGELIVGHHDSWSWGSRDHGKVTVYVTAPSLSAAAVAGSGGMKVDRVAGGHFEAAVSGSGDLAIASLKAEEVSFSVSGSGNLSAVGAAHKASVSITGSGSLEGPAFETRDASVSIVGSGDAQLRATGNAGVNIVGSGNAEIRGGAKCQVSKIGSGNADCQA